MNYGSICSGIEAATVAWNHMGWTPDFFSQYDPEHNYKSGPDFPGAVLAHHYADIPNLGDMTQFKDWDPKHYEKTRLLVGGTPCQSFSVAGLRRGLDDPRGNLMLTYLAMAECIKPDWIVWENVPGVLSSNGGRDFGTFLGALAKIGYGFAYRILDAQYFGVPQRRRRLFVIGYLGNWRPAAAVLFERESLRGDSAPGRKAGKEIAGTIDASLGRSRGAGTNPGAITHCMAHGQGGAEIRANQPPTLTCNHEAPIGFIERPCQPVSGALCAQDGNGVHGQSVDDHKLIPLSVHGTQDPDINVNLAHPLGRNHGQENAVAIGWSEELTAHYELAGTLQRGGNGGRHDGVAIAFNGDQSAKTRSMGETIEQSPTLRSGGTVHVSRHTAVRRLTPRECERLQGFPDDYTLIPWKKKPAELCPDGPRYKALGNSMAVPVMRWIGERIERVDSWLQFHNG